MIPHSRIENLSFIIGVMFVPILFYSQTERWVYRYNGPGDGADEATRIICGQDGNLYAVGNSTGSGTWYDFTVISFDTQGNQRWIYRYDGPASYYEFGSSIVSGEDGNIYASGSRSRYMGYYEAIVMSLDSSGNERWFCVDSLLLTVQIVYGQDRNIYGAGYRSNMGTGDDIAIISHDAQGNIRWLYQYYDPYSDWPYSIACGRDENIYTVGTSYNDSYSNSSLLVISITPGGSERWIYSYELPGNIMSDFDAGYSIAFGQNGDIYIAGVTTDTITRWDFTVISLDTLGNERWVYRYNGPGNNYDVARSLVYGQDGNIYAAGYSTGSGTSDDFTIISLDTQGNERWVYQYNGPNSSMDIANAVVYGIDNNIYAAGYSSGSDSKFDFTVVSLDTMGSERWVYRYNGPGNDRDEANSIIYGQDGNLYAAGFSSNSSGYEDWDFTVISLEGGVGVEEFKFPNCEPQIPAFEVYPNPFSKKTEIRWTTYNLRSTTIRIYDATGRLVKTFNDILCNLNNSVQSVSWDGTDNFSQKLPPGVYFIQLVAEPVGKVEDFKKMEKAVMLK